MHHQPHRGLGQRPSVERSEPQNRDYEPFIVWVVNSARSALCYVCQRPTTTRASLASTPEIQWAACSHHPNEAVAAMIARHQET